MELDEIFDQQVKLRDGMAKKLGFENYVDLAYLIMQRVDYSQDDVARYRNMVKQDVTPVCEIIRERQAAHIGVENVAYWNGVTTRIVPFLVRLEEELHKNI